MHMPLRQFLEYKGDNRGEPSWPQAIDTGLYDAIMDPEIGNKSTLGLFVGHDHLNSFEFRLQKDGVLLAYGLTSGYNAYGTHDKGARIIKFTRSYSPIITYNVRGKDLRI